jgi:hypothetical protein
MFAVSCCLLTARQAQAQNAYGYTSISHDGSTVSGYAATDLDYETAYYYDAQVQAHIEDEYGNVLASGTAEGNPSAFTFLDVFEAALCIRFSIISYVIATPRFLGCNGGYYDFWGFSDYWWGEWWDYGGFFGSRQNRCIFNRLIFIASIITDVIRCLPASVSCQASSLQVLPSGVGDQARFINGLNPSTTRDTMTVTCTATNPVTGQGQSGVRINFGFGSDVIQDNGGHDNHLTNNVTPRPVGRFQPSVGRTNGSGVVTTTYTAPQHAGTFRFQVSSEETGHSSFADVVVKVPNFVELGDPVGNAGYVLTGADTYHPSNHWGKPEAVASLRQIGIDYKNTLFPESTNPNGVPLENALKFNDISVKFGGKFDIPNSRTDVPRWREDGSHVEHKVGINCDISINGVPNDNVTVGGVQRSRREVVEEIFANNGSSRTNREFCRNHWHVRFEYGGGNNPTEGCPTRQRRRNANPARTRPARGAAPRLPGRVEAELYDEDSDEIAGAFAPADSESVANEAVVYSYPRTHGLSTGGGQYVETAGEQWMTYTVDVTSSGSYTFEAGIASTGSWNTFHVEVDGVDVTGPIGIPNTGSGEAFQPVTFENIWLEAGRHIVTIEVDGSGPNKGNFDYFSFNPYVPPWVCDPPWWEINQCQSGGGSWDYGMCACNYGWYYY